MSEKRSAVLVRGRFNTREHTNNFWAATVEQGVTQEDILKPEFWSHVSSLMRPYDRIEVRWDDGIAWAELLVKGCDRAYAMVELLTFKKLTTADVAMTQFVTHEVKWRGPVLKWSIVRLSDAEPIKDKCESREEAEGWMKDYLNKVAA